MYRSSFLHNCTVSTFFINNSVQNKSIFHVIYLTSISPLGPDHLFMFISIPYLFWIISPNISSLSSVLVNRPPLKSVYIFWYFYINGYGRNLIINELLIYRSLNIHGIQHFLGVFFCAIDLVSSILNLILLYQKATSSKLLKSETK